MQITSRLTMAAHVLVYTSVHAKEKVTSQMIAKSVNTNPVIIRRLLMQLKDAGIIEVVRGTGGINILKPLNKITLLDIYNAVEATNNEDLFAMHSPNKRDKVGKKINVSLKERLDLAEKALEKQLSKTTVAMLVNEVKQ